MEKLIVLRHAFEILFDFVSDDDESCDEEATNRQKIEKNKNYAEEVVPRFSNLVFKNHFRVDPDTFEQLCREIHASEEHHLGPGRTSTLIEKQLMITLWYLGNPECMRSIADRFGVCIASVWRLVSATCDVLIKLNRTRKYIRWPTTDEADRTSSFYFRKNGFPGIIGSIDGSHIPIRAPIYSHNSYINRKGFHSVLLQGVCNHRMEFIYCYTGEAGSIHDALLLRRSGLINKIASGDFCINENQHLLGDSAYPLKQWLLTPYRDNGRLRQEHKVYNITHSKCRVTIERAFGLLKGRFRRLFHIDSLKPTLIVKYIMASCILHNICIQSNDMGEEYVLYDDSGDSEINNETDSIDMQSGYSKRESICNSL